MRTFEHPFKSDVFAEWLGPGFYREYLLSFRSCKTPLLASQRQRTFLDSYEEPRWLLTGRSHTRPKSSLRRESVGGCPWTTRAKIVHLSLEVFVARTPATTTNTLALELDASRGSYHAPQQLQPSVSGGGIYYRAESELGRDEARIGIDRFGESSRESTRSNPNSFNRAL
jgi:hypothetical protein